MSRVSGCAEESSPKKNKKRQKHHTIQSFFPHRRPHVTKTFSLLGFPNCIYLIVIILVYLISKECPRCRSTLHTLPTSDGGTRWRTMSPSSRGPFLTDWFGTNLFTPSSKKLLPPLVTKVKIRSCLATIFCNVLELVLARFTLRFIIQIVQAFCAQTSLIKNLLSPVNLLLTDESFLIWRYSKLIYRSFIADTCLYHIIGSLY